MICALRRCFSLHAWSWEVRTAGLLSKFEQLGAPWLQHTSPVRPTKAWLPDQLGARAWFTQALHPTGKHLLAEFLQTRYTLGMSFTALTATDMGATFTSQYFSGYAFPWAYTIRWCLSDTAVSNDEMGECSLLPLQYQRSPVGLSLHQLTELATFTGTAVGSSDECDPQTLQKTHSRFCFWPGNQMRLLSRLLFKLN